MLLCSSFLKFSFEIFNKNHMILKATGGGGGLKKVFANFNVGNHFMNY